MPDKETNKGIQNKEDLNPLFFEFWLPILVIVVVPFVYLVLLLSFNYVFLKVVKAQLVAFDSFCASLDFTYFFGA